MQVLIFAKAKKGLQNAGTLCLKYCLKRNIAAPPLNSWHATLKRTAMQIQ